MDGAAHVCGLILQRTSRRESLILRWSRFSFAVAREISTVQLNGAARNFTLNTAKDIRATAISTTKIDRFKHKIRLGRVWKEDDE